MRRVLHKGWGRALKLVIVLVSFLVVGVAYAAITHQTMTVILANNASGLVMAWQKEFTSTLTGATNSTSRQGIDSTGALYAVATADDVGYYGLVKYNSSTGNPIWSVESQYPAAQNHDAVVSVGGNSFGEAFLAYNQKASACGCAFNRAFIVRHLSTGSFDSTWTKTLGGNILVGVYDMVIDSGDNVIVLAYGDSAASTNMRLLKYNRSGSLLYDRSFPIANSGYVASAVNLAVDTSGSVYVLGRTTSSDILVKKFDTTLLYSGQQATYSGANMASPQYKNITVDSAGNVYITGTDNASWSDYVTVKFSSAGVLAWANTFNLAYERAYDVGIDSQNNLYVIGWSTIGSNDTENLIVKYNAVTGSQVGSMRTHYSATAIEDLSKEIDIDAARNVYFSTRLYPRVEVIKFMTGCSGPNPAYTTWPTDQTITTSVTKVRTGHITDLRARIDALRTDAGTSTYSWTDVSLSSVGIKAAHINQMRRALEDVYTLCGQNPAPTWTDGPSVAAGGSIRAQHITDLRTAVENAW